GSRAAGRARAPTVGRPPRVPDRLRFRRLPLRSAQRGAIRRRRSGTRSRGRWTRHAPSRTARPSAIRMPSHTRPYGNILETIGWTPLVRLNRVTHELRTPVYAKAEVFNPGAYVKDRLGLDMISAAEAH